jgi:glycosyltransferase involved in cell wall biosynthesis
VKVLILSWEFPPYTVGGLGRHVAELAPALAEQGVQVHILTPNPQVEDTSELLQPNLYVHWVGTPGVEAHVDIYTRACQINDLLKAAGQRLWAELDGFDLIHAHDWLVGRAAVALKQTYKCPIVATIHATEVGRWRSEYLADGLSQSIDQVEKQLSFEAWRVIACSHYMVGELRRHFRLPSDKLDMIPNGINLAERPHFEPDDLAAFRRFYVSRDDPLIFSVGRLVFEKGHHFLLGAMPQILTAFPRTKLVLAGKGPLRGYLQGIVDNLKIADSVHFAGFITDLERDKFLSVANCAIFPSLYEPFGIVALEAMAFNCPVVVSNIGGFAEVVRHEETGILVYPDNSDSIAWGILQVLKKPILIKEYGANARRMIEEEYNWQRVARETIKVFERVINERSSTDW